MSRADTGRRQEMRLRELGHVVALLPTLTDMDTAADIVTIADVAPATRTVHLARRMGLLASSRVS